MQVIAIFFTSGEHVIFPNTSIDSCTFIVCFEAGKLLFSPPLGENRNSCEISHFPVSKQTMKVQFPLNVLGRKHSK